MADNDNREKHPNELETNTVTPRTVDPEHRDHRGGADRDRASSDDRPGPSIRRDPEVVETDGGDQFGIAGGGIDRKASGLGGNQP